MERIEQTLQRTPDQVVVDGGYISHNIVEMAKRGIDLVGPRGKSAEANRRKSYQRYGIISAFEASSFVHDEASNTYVCPQGKRLRYDAKFERDGMMRYRQGLGERLRHVLGQGVLLSSRVERSVEKARTLAGDSRIPAKMQTDEAKAMTRSAPNLWIKAKFGLRQFSVRGIAKVRTESLWAALTYANPPAEPVPA